MNIPFKPQCLIPDALIRQLRESASIAEANGSLTPDQLAIIFREGWFRMFLPRSMGGLELSLPDGLRLQESLAWIDGSLGWTITLCSGATMFAGYMAPQVASTLLVDPTACFGGSGQPSGTATAVDSGYLINGRWRYATGAPHLSVFTANCRIEQGGRPVLDHDGQALIRSFFFMREEVRIEEDWHTMGLKATAGHAFSVRGLWVTEDRSFLISPDSANNPVPIFQYPFLPFAEATLAVNTLGMTLHFMELCERIFAQREIDKRYDDDTLAMVNDILTEAKEDLARLRDPFYDAVAHSWNELSANGIATPDMLATVGTSSRSMVKGCRQLVQDLYPYCGMAAADPRTELNRAWRDIFTASQHSLLTYPAH